MSVLNTSILDKINGMTTIKLSRKDLIGSGSFADVYLYKIENTELALKCFKDESKARKEDAIY